MSTARYLIGDVFDVMGTMPDASVDLVLTSPPFLALRSYLPADHPDKGKEIGSEPSPAEFLDTLLALTAEWGRLLTPYGSLCVELGDTYAGSGNGEDPGRHLAGGTWTRRNPGPGWPLDKSLCGIPHLYHLSLAYGRNLLTGEESPAGMWRVRNVVAWCRPNPAVGALGDKFRPATSYMTIATRARDRWFDLDAVRHHNPRANEIPTTGGREQARADIGLSSQDSVGQPAPQNPNGAPPLDWWEIPTEAYPGSHYATWPRKLLDRPIKAMCPMQVCTTCGEPRRRIVEATTYDTPRVRTARPIEAAGSGHRSDRPSANPETLGFTDCGHDSWRNGVVLDPFAGSGTTLAVATGHGRDAIGIDLDERNADLASERIGMFLTVEDAREVLPL